LYVFNEHTGEMEQCSRSNCVTHVFNGLFLRSFLKSLQQKQISTVEFRKPSDLDFLPVKIVTDVIFPMV
jgi:hypothetical protein